MKSNRVIMLALSLVFGCALPGSGQMDPQDQETAKKEIGEVVTRLRCRRRRRSPRNGSQRLEFFFLLPPVPGAVRWGPKYFSLR
jgi:hypothetical protein